MTSSLALDPLARVVFSPDRRHRYYLRRPRWSDSPACAFIMLNPSTADENADDPTVRRCLAFARAFDCGSLIVGNLFGWRATDPEELPDVADPVGPDNDDALRRIASDAGLVVAAWGDGPSSSAAGRALLATRSRFVREELLSGVALARLTHLTAAGNPRHPLYLPATARPALLGGAR